MTLIPLTCPLCQGVFQVDSAHAGSDVACPHCAKTVRLPAELAMPVTIGRSSASDAPSSPPAANAPAPPAQPTFSFPAPPPMPGDAVPPPPLDASGVPAAFPQTASSAAPPVANAPPIAETPSPAEVESHLPRLACATCANLFRVPLDSAGGRVHCPSCNAIVEVPSILVDAPDVPDVEKIVAPEYQIAEPEESADEAIERGGIRRLTREERAQARARKNLFMLVAGFLLLVGSIFVLQSFEPFFLKLWEKSGLAPAEEAP